MVLLLNYSHVIIFLILAFFLYRSYQKNKEQPKVFQKRAAIAILIAVIAWLAIGPLTASYLPKGTTALAEVPNPAFEAPAETVVIQDRLRAPVRTGEAAAERLDEKLDWRKHKAEREAAKNAPKAEPETKQ